MIAVQLVGWALLAAFATIGTILDIARHIRHARRVEAMRRHPAGKFLDSRGWSI